MSKFFFPAKSSIELTSQQCIGFQSGFSGWSFGISGSSSGASSSNAQQANIGVANETVGSAPAAVAGAGAIVKLNGSIRPPKPFYPKEDGDIKTWTNMTVQSEEDASKSTDDVMVLATGGDTFQTVILVVQGCSAGIEIQDLIVDSKSAVSIVSSEFYETIINEKQLQPNKVQYIGVT